MKKVFAPIDEKNVCTDWIESIFDENNLTQTQKNSLCKLCGYILGELVECVYNTGNNTITWYCYTSYAKMEDVQSELIKRLKDCEDPESGLFSEIQQSETFLIQKFYFKGDEE